MSVFRSLQDVNHSLETFSDAAFKRELDENDGPAQGRSYLGAVFFRIGTPKGSSRLTETPTAAAPSAVPNVAPNAVPSAVPSAVLSESPSATTKEEKADVGEAKTVAVTEVTETKKEATGETTLLPNAASMDTKTEEVAVEEGKEVATTGETLPNAATSDTKTEEVAVVEAKEAETTPNAATVDTKTEEVAVVEAKEAVATPSLSVEEKVEPPQEQEKSSS